MCYMPRVSLTHAMLGFLDLEPTSGYTLAQRFEGSVGSFWSATQSQIYRELHAAESKGLVAVEVQPQAGKPARKVYRVTPAGRAELARWLADPVTPAQVRDPFLLRLVFSGERPVADIVEMIGGWADALGAYRAELTARLDRPDIFSLARHPREALLWRLSIEAGVAACDAQIRWAERARGLLLASERS